MIVANTTQFDNGVEASAKKAESVFARLAKLQFQPKIAPVIVPVDDRPPGPYLPAPAPAYVKRGGPLAPPGQASKVVTEGRPRGDSLVALIGVIDRVKAGFAQVGRLTPFTSAVKQYANFMSFLSRPVDLVGARVGFRNLLGEIAKMPRQVYAYARDVEINFAGMFDRGVNAAKRAATAVTASVRSVSRAQVYDAVRVRAAAVTTRVATTARSTATRVAAFLPSPVAVGLGLAAAAGVSTYQVTALGHAVAGAAIENDRFAVSAKLNVVALQRQQFVMRELGGEAKDYVAALQAIEQLQVSARVGDYGTKDLTGRLGGDVNSMLQSGADLMKTMEGVNDAISSQGVGLRAAVLASHVYGENALAVLRYLTASKQVRGDMGLSAPFMDTDQISYLRRAELAVTHLKMSAEGLATKLIVALTPFALMVLDVLEKLVSGVNGDKLVGVLVSIASHVTSFFMNLPVVMEMAQTAIERTVAQIMRGFDRLQEQMVRIQSVGVLATGDVTKSNELTAAADAMRVLREDASVPIAGRPWWRVMGEDANAAMDRLRGKLVSTQGVAVAIAARMTTAGATKPFFDIVDKFQGFLRVNERLISGAKATTAAAVQPYEALTARMRELNMQLALPDNLSKESYGRSNLKLLTDAESQLGVLDIRLPSPASRDSVDAVGAINRSEVEYRLKVADTPAVRMQRVLDQSYAVLLLIQAAAEKAADAALQRRDTVGIGP